jgi:hypothetical protein
MDELIVEFSDDGIMSTPWWTKELGEMMAIIGEQPDEFKRNVNENPYCG